MDTPITHAEQTQFEKLMDAELNRLADEDNRQNKRIDALESKVTEIGSISTSVEKLALNMENMLKEQISQGERLKILENRDGETWRTVVRYLLTLIVGAFGGYILRFIGLG